MTARIVNPDYNMDLELPGFDRMTDDEFFNFCAQNKNIQIERDENLQIYIMPPAGSESSGQNLDLATEVNLWNRKYKLGKTREATAGYYLPDKSMLSPDVSWMTNEKWSTIPLGERKQFPHITPDFVIELMSPTDRLSAAKKKMTKWIENGVLLGWLINPKTETTTIYRADGTVENVIGFDKKLSGEDVLPGLELDLSILK